MDARSDVLSWPAVEALAARLADGLREACGRSDFDRVVGIARGGLVPAVLVASRLDVKRLESVQVRLYDGAEKLAAPAFVGPPVPVAGPSGDAARTLIVDEILDSGSTLAFLQRTYPAATYAALVARRGREVAPARGGLCGCAAGGGPSPVWVARSLETDAWILFPWSPAEDRRVAGAAES